MDERSLDRRFDWGSKIVWAVIIATAWCVKLEFTVSELKKDADQREARVDTNRENRNKDLLQMTERIRTNEVDIGWLKKGCK